MEYFKKLNINENSSKDDIKNAYFKLILKHHPDKGGDPQTFIQIKKIYDSLLISNFTSNTNNKPFKEDSKTFSTSTTQTIKQNNKSFINSLKKKYDFRTIFVRSIIGYITLRHILPKKELIFDNYNSLGDQLIGHTYVNCILFDQVQKWYTDGDLVYTLNSYFWRRTKIVDCNDKK